MAIINDFSFMSLASLEDPDDYRPDSYISLNVDPGENGKRVEQMVVFREKIAPGDQIPLHRHTMEEIMMVDKGALQVSLGENKYTAKAGSVIFIPGLELHGFKNMGSEHAQITAVFPSRYVDICYEGRNPAPGTENDAPQPPVNIDVRALAEGDLDNAVEEISKDRFQQRSQTS